MAQDSINRTLITGLDVGSSKVTVVVAEILADGRFEVIGTASHPSQGLKQGVVVNIETTVHAIREAVNQVELMADCKIEHVWASISGNHIASRDTTGMVAITNNEVSLADVQRVLDSASTIALTADQRMLHVVPQEYIIDHQAGIAEPVGMSGVRLEVKVHMITCASSALQNLTKCIQQCNLGIAGIALESLAASHAVLTDDERELGVCVINIGAGKTDMTIFVEGALCHVSTVPIAGHQVTRDIAMLLRTPRHDAENIKLEHAYAYSELVDINDVIQVTSVGGRAPRELTLETLVPAVEMRYEEILKLVQEHITRSGYLEMLRAGIVITGGGSKIQGLVELAEQVMEMPTRIGEPHGFDSVIPEIYDPQYATCIGLLIHGKNYLNESKNQDKKPAKPRKNGIFKQTKAWITNNF